MLPPFPINKKRTPRAPAYRIKNDPRCWVRGTIRATPTQGWLRHTAFEWAFRRAYLPFVPVCTRNFRESRPCLGWDNQSLLRDRSSNSATSHRVAGKDCPFDLLRWVWDGSLSIRFLPAVLRSPLVWTVNPQGSVRCRVCPHDPQGQQARKVVAYGRLWAVYDHEKPKRRRWCDRKIVPLSYSLSPFWARKIRASSCHRTRQTIIPQRIRRFRN